jgi:plastocyanin
MRPRRKYKERSLKMNTNKLLNWLIILTLLLPALLTGSPTLTRAAPRPPNTAETTGPGTSLSAFPSAPAGILTSPNASVSGVAPSAVNQYLTIEPLCRYGDLWGCTSVYTITNESSDTATTQHQFYYEYDYPVHSFDDSIAAKTSKVYDLACIDGIPDGYTSGYAFVASDRPITYTLDPCPRQQGGTAELNPGESTTQTFNEEGIYPVTDPTTKKSGEVQVGMGITSLSLSASSVTTVSVTEDGFTPQVAQVAVGDTVKFVNEDSETRGAIVLKRVWPLFLPLVVCNQ